MSTTIQYKGASGRMTTYVAHFVTADYALVHRGMNTWQIARRGGVLYEEQYADENHALTVMAQLQRNLDVERTAPAALVSTVARPGQDRKPEWSVSHQQHGYCGRCGLQHWQGAEPCDRPDAPMDTFCKWDGYFMSETHARACEEGGSKWQR